NRPSMATPRKLGLEENLPTSASHMPKQPSSCQRRSPAMKLSPSRQEMPPQSPVLCNPEKKSPVTRLFQSVKQALHIAIPERLLSREAEQASIRSFLKDKVLQHTPSSLYISGVPGTGKTACLDCVLEEMKVGCGCSVSNEKADHSLQVTQSVETCYCQYLDKIPLQFWSHL
ncbi:hypothetical protein XENOCAPTIV_005099, partial [Xenoophorus captivus]